VISTVTAWDERAEQLFLELNSSLSGIVSDYVKAWREKTLYFPFLHFLFHRALLAADSTNSSSNQTQSSGVSVAAPGHCKIIELPGTYADVEYNYRFILERKRKDVTALVEECFDEEEAWSAFLDNLRPLKALQSEFESLQLGAIPRHQASVSVALGCAKWIEELRGLIFNESWETVDL